MCNFNGLELKERENLEDEHAGKNYSSRHFLTACVSFQLDWPTDCFKVWRVYSVKPKPKWEFPKVGDPHTVA